MTDSFDELGDVLRTFTTDEFRPVIELVTKLSAMDGTSISKNERAIPASNLRDIYKVRALNPRLPKARVLAARLCEPLRRVA